MKKILVFCLTLLSFLTFSHFTYAYQKTPGRTAYSVNDYANILDKDTKDYLENLASSVKRKGPDPIEVIVATFDFTDSSDPKKFAYDYAEKWRLTKTGRDNGVVIFLSIKDGYFDIGVGRNLRSIITPDMVSDIINDYVAPNFRKGDYRTGIKKTAEAIVDVLKKADIPSDKPSKLNWPVVIILAVAVSALIIRWRAKR